MTDANQSQMGNTLWSIADQLQGAMYADDFHSSLPCLFIHQLP